MTLPKPILAPCICGDPNCGIPYGYCHCRCGSKTPIARYTDQWAKVGMPRKFIQYHQRKIRPHIEKAKPFKIDGVYCRLIPVNHGLYTIVDESDYAYLMQWKWWASKCRKTGKWVVGRDETCKGKTTRILMHRQIAAKPDLPEVDHWNGNGLDNRRNNLRPCTRAENNRNKGPNKNNATGLKGVIPVNKRFRATVYANGKHYHQGYFDTAQQASDAYWKAAKRLHGRFAKR